MVYTPPTLNVLVQKMLSDGQRHFNLKANFSSNGLCTAFYGPSGAGKTLTLNAIAGLLNPDQAKICFGQETFIDTSAGINLSPAQRKIGYVFQHYALFPHLSVEQNIRYGLTTWRKRRLSAKQTAYIKEIINRLGLSELVNSRPSALSGGQKQRAALARALACQPQLLLLDEPFAALNPMLRTTLRNDLKQLCLQHSLPAIIVSHDIEDVLALADTVHVFNEGEIIETISLKQLSQTDRRAHLERVAGQS